MQRGPDIDIAHHGITIEPRDEPKVEIVAAVRSAVDGCMVEVDERRLQRLRRLMRLIEHGPQMIHLVGELSRRSGGRSSYQFGKCPLRLSEPSVHLVRCGDEELVRERALRRVFRNVLIDLVVEGLGAEVGDGGAAQVLSTVGESDDGHLASVRGRDGIAGLLA